MNPQKKAALAFSGGLDTSFCVKYLSLEQGYEVHAAYVDTGGAAPPAELEAQALRLGAASFVSLDRKREYYEQCLRYLLFGNVLRNGTYPLSVSAERAFQAKAVAQYAQQIGADALAHGSTGAGNDQVRFDMAFQILMPQAEVLTPIRDMGLSRKEEVDYLAKHGFSRSWEQARYSINEGLWGTSVGGAETLTSDTPLPESAWPTQVSETEAQTIDIGFERGEPVSLDGQAFAHPVELIETLTGLAAPYGVGRDVHVGDTVIGIKGRVGFEAAAPLILIKAHHLLEKHCLTKWQQVWKAQMAEWYGMAVHEGNFLEPGLRDIETLLSSSQRRVSGTVKVRLLPYRFELLGVNSPYDLMQASGDAYGEANEGWSGADVRGFAKIAANQTRLFHSAEKPDA